MSQVPVPSLADSDLALAQTRDSLVGLVFDVKKFSVHDGPGIRTTVFFKGCPLACRWCHNPESQVGESELVVWRNRCVGCGACLSVCPVGAISLNGTSRVDGSRCVVCGACAEVCYAEACQVVGRQMTVSEVMAAVRRDVPFYDQSGGGMTCSGGEPLSQPEFLLALLLACQEGGIHTALDTCGYAPWPVLDRVRHHVDLFLYDLKLMDGDRHLEFTGVSNDLILDNLWKLSRRGHAIYLRMPIIPGVNDAEAHVRRVGAFAAQLPHLERVDLLPYHPTASDKYARLDRTYGLGQVRPPSDEHVAEIARILTGFDLTINVGG